MQILSWIQDWYKRHCNESWEHSYSLRIESLDNPGWRVEIDLEDTELEGMVIEYKLIEKSKGDWYGLKIEDNVFHAAGDPAKLQFLLEKFKEIAMSAEKGRPA
jgi:hypothetical protein